MSYKIYYESKSFQNTICILGLVLICFVHIFLLGKLVCYSLTLQMQKSISKINLITIKANTFRLKSHFDILSASISNTNSVIKYHRIYTRTQKKIKNKNAENFSTKALVVK